MQLDGAVAIVTGAAQNIGRCIAVALAEAGCRVAAIDLDGERLETLADERIDVLAGDVADPEQAARVVDTSTSLPAMLPIPSRRRASSTR
ncbi:MAG: 2,3-dihydro-2,3-dihydroxybenzoate dehydrogenase [Candidatus Accumulibacter sp. SK-11]|nr:MAG: 2,3-dihydro-2,3-dihydroxybenzoate dehydrogenase [Candidatus Accumulibacter sp. SK-11]